MIKKCKKTKKISSFTLLIRLYIMTANKKYKDSLFRSIFNNEEGLLELINAIQGTNYTDASIIKINTLDDVFFKAMKNDISFTVNEKLVVLIEHQSTINDNMPLRLLLYIARIYEKIADMKDRYKASLKKIPKPQFIVLYNGEAPFPKEKTIKLSDMFEKIDDDDLIPLDLTVKVLNINKGVNPELEGKSETLNAYVTFTAKAREYEKEHMREEALRLAVAYCIENGIMTDYFRHNASEVANMFMTEYSIEDAIEVAHEEGKEKGQSYVLELMAQGLSYEEIKRKIEGTQQST